jgi:hypothetical protein
MISIGFVILINFDLKKLEWLLFKREKREKSLLKITNYKITNYKITNYKITNYEITCGCCNLFLS